MGACPIAKKQGSRKLNRVGKKSRTKNLKKTTNSKFKKTNYLSYIKKLNNMKKLTIYIIIIFIASFLEGQQNSGNSKSNKSTYRNGTNIKPVIHAKKVYKYEKVFCEQGKIVVYGSSTGAMGDWNEVNDPDNTGKPCDGSAAWHDGINKK